MSTHAILTNAPLMNASRMLAERGFFGIVWIDTELHVSARYGPLVSFVEIGEPVTDSIFALAGLEDELLALRNASAQTVIDLPSVTIITEKGRTPRLNLAATWSGQEECLLLLVSRAVVNADLEVELNRQIRARLMAEADLKTKSLALEQANRDLALANTDLEQFASIISHDLKAPMREMRFLTSDANKNLTDGDVQGAREKLAAMEIQSSRMAQMLNALLDYATAVQKSDAIERVETATLTKAIVQGLPAAPGIDITLEGEWPSLETLAAPLDIVLRNLIDNAIAHHDRSAGKIQLRAIEQPNAVIFEVRDDGPGIDPKHHQAIFLPFRTIANNTKNPHHGMGLALVARLVNAVGGTVTIHSEGKTKRGTTFRVLWPKTIPDI